MKIQDQITKQPRLQEIVEPLLEWYAQNARDLPWRYNTLPYPVWVSEIMLQQTRVEAVKPYFTRFMEQLPTLQALAKVAETELLKLWEGLGYYSRARNLQKAAQIICQSYDGIFPSNYEQIRALPGIGDYTAGAISSICFNQPTPAVDGNVLRVIARFTANPTDITDLAYKKLIAKELAGVYPVQHCGDFTQSLMELGATVCTPKQAPDCNHCPLMRLCQAYQSDLQGVLPVKSKKKARKQEHKTVLLLYYKGKLAVGRRNTGGLLGGLYELPNIEGALTPDEVVQQLSSWGISVNSITPSRSRKHIFTHVEWLMSSYQIDCAEMSPDYQWVTDEELLEQIAMPTAFKKLLSHKSST